MQMLKMSEKTCVRLGVGLALLQDATEKFGEDAVKEHVVVILPAVEKRDLGWCIVPDLKVIES